MFIHTIDIVQPPGIRIPPDMDVQRWKVVIALATNRSAQIARKVLSRVAKQMRVIRGTDTSTT
jgi:hypothetical protein